MEELPKGFIDKFRFRRMIDQWMDYAKKHLIESKISGLPEVRTKLIAADLADPNREGSGKALAIGLAEEYTLDEQRRLLEDNKNRLITLARLTGRKPKELKGTTVVSIGGGPGDKICEPWFPRLAGALTGARVINFDNSPAHPVDVKMGIYEHRGGSAGDIFQLLLNRVTIGDALAAAGPISIIECNNLIGNNVSPSLGMALGRMEGLENDPRIVQMRTNLRNASEQLLMEGGVLAIDDGYWIKREGSLTPVDEQGNNRTAAILAEEQILG